MHRHGENSYDGRRNRGESNGFHNGYNPVFDNDQDETTTSNPLQILKDRLQHILDLSTGNAIVILIFMVFVLVACCIVTGLIYYHYSNRTRRWIKITKTMHQRLSKQILLDEKLKELCQKIGVSAEVINADRKVLCPDIEEMVDLPAARYVDPFRAPSNMYEQINEKDDDAKTLRNLDPDVFLRKDDLKSCASTTTKDTPAAAAPAGTPTPTTPAAAPTATSKEGEQQQQQKPGSSEPPKPEEKKNTDKCDKPPEIIKSSQA